MPPRIPKRPMMPPVRPTAKPAPTPTDRGVSSVEVIDDEVTASDTAPTKPVLRVIHMMHIERGNGTTLDKLKKIRPTWNSDRAAFEKAAAAITDFAKELRATGGKLSVMAPAQWWSACTMWAPTWAKDLDADGHFCGLHERGGYSAYNTARDCLKQAVGYNPRPIASGVLSSEVGEFPPGWSFTGMSFSPGHGASTTSMAGMHWCGIWKADTAEQAIGSVLSDKGNYLFMSSGTGSNSKLVQMASDVQRHGGVAVYNDPENDDVVTGYSAGLHHAVMLDPNGGTITGISPGDTVERILLNAETAFRVKGIVGATVPEVIDDWSGEAFQTRTAGRDAGENHYVGIGGGVH